MGAILTVDELKQHVETDLDLDALQHIIDANDQEIIKRFGPHANSGNRIERIVGSGSRYITLSHPASAIVSVVEHENGVDTTLSANDYAHRTPSVLERLDTGDNPRLNWPGQNIDVEGFSPSWSNAATVTYTPIDYDARRRMVLIDLCKLELAFSGHRLLGIGDYRESAILDAEGRREEILMRLVNRGMPFA